MLDTTGNGPGGFLRITREGFPGESIRICEVPPPPGATSADSFFTQIADLPQHPTRWAVADVIDSDISLAITNSSRGFITF